MLPCETVSCPFVHTSSDRNTGLPSPMLSCQVVARARAMFLLPMSQVLGSLSVVTWPWGPYVRVITRGAEGTAVHTALSQAQRLHKRETYSFKTLQSIYLVSPGPTYSLMVIFEIATCTSSPATLYRIHKAPYYNCSYLLPAF